MTKKDIASVVGVHGWYEHDDGTVGEYVVRGGRARLVRQVGSWAEVPRAARAGRRRPLLVCAPPASARTGVAGAGAS